MVIVKIHWWAPIDLLEQWFLTCAYRSPRDFSASEQLNIGKKKLFWDTANLQEARGKVPRILLNFFFFFKWIELELVPKRQTGRVGAAREQWLTGKLSLRPAARLEKEIWNFPTENSKARWSDSRKNSSILTLGSQNSNQLKSNSQSKITKHFIQKGIHGDWESVETKPRN